MMDRSEDNLRRRLGGFSLLGAPLLLLVADCLQVVGGHVLLWTTIGWCAFVLFIPAALALGHLARPQAGSFDLIGSSCAIVGAMAAAQMMTMLRIRGILLRGVPGLPSDAMQRIFKAEPLLFMTIFPLAIFFSLGLIILGIALLRTARFGLLAPLLLALGGLLFPFAHAAGVALGLVGGDLLLLFALGLIARSLWRDPTAW